MSDQEQKKPKASKRKITEMDLEAGRNIKRLYELAKSEGKVKNQEDFGSLFGFGQSFVTQITNGKTACPADKIMLIAAYFGISTQAIRSDLPDLKPATADGLDERLLAEVWEHVIDGLKSKGFQLDKIRADKLVRLVIKSYKESQKTHKVDKNLISFAVELLA